VIAAEYHRWPCTCASRETQWLGRILLYQYHIPHQSSQGQTTLGHLVTLRAQTISKQLGVLLMVSPSNHLVELGTKCEKVYCNKKCL